MLVATAGLVLVSAASTGLSYLLLRSQVDPEVIVYTKSDDRRSTILLIVIDNIGNGVARNVRCKASRPIPDEAFRIQSTGQPGEFEEIKEGPLINGIPMLAPGERRVITWGQYGGLLDELGDEPLMVEAFYSSKRRFPWQPRTHLSESLLEVGSFTGTDASEAPEARIAKQLERLVTEVQKMTREIK